MMSIKILKAVAVLLMLLALAWIFGAVTANTRSVEIQGPSALAVLPDQSVWISVDKALWHMNESGKRVALVDGDALGVGGRIGNLVLHPNGQLVAQVRGDTTLYFLDAETAVIQSRLAPQWQADLERHGDDAINYAFHSDGRVAIATGGGHAVALFDAQGRFLARTKPDLYRFTNGLWWVGDTLWTTDTNRQELVELDGSTLAERSRVQLSRNCGGFQFLGYAAPSHGKPSEGSQNAPLTTLVRFANGMTKGRASDIFPDGTQLDYPVSTTTEPRDIKWRGAELLMVDGANFAIKRYSDERVPMDDFGDTQVQDDLKRSFYQRSRLQNQYKLYIGGAILFFLIGFGFALRAQLMEKRQALAALKVDLSQLGTPILSLRTRLVGMLELMWPLFLIVGVYVLLLAFLFKGKASPEMLMIVLVTILLLFPLSLFLIRLNVRYFQGLPETEGLFNQQAIQFLQTNANFWRSCQPGELPQETLMLRAFGEPSWIVLTNQRLLHFAVNLRDRTLVREYPRNELLRVRLPEKHEMTRRQKLQRLFNAYGAIVSFEFRDGTSLSGFTVSKQTAQRIAAQLTASPTLDAASNEIFTQPPTQAGIPKFAIPNNKARIQAISSMLIPGLGQWIQRRSGTALIFFVVWLFVLWDAVLIALTLWKAMSDVSWLRILTTASYYLLVCGLAAWETWRMRERN